MTHPSSSLGPDATPRGASLLRALERIRARARAVLVWSRLLTVIAIVLGVAIALGLTDYFLRLPTWVRTLHWLAGAAAIGWAWVRYMRPAVRFSPSLTDVALRVEGAVPEVRGVLASATDFARAGDASGRAGGSDVSRALASKVIDDAAGAWDSSRDTGLIRSKPLARRAAWCGAAVACIALLSVLSTSLTTIGATRLLVPWAGASWPKRTGVVDVTSESVHARGTALPLQAAVVKSNRAWDDTYVAVEYRLITGEETGSARRELLTWQQRRVDISDATGEPSDAELFERLIEPVADAVEFRFETEDDVTEWRRVELVAPPSVVDASVRITPPEYAARLAAAGGADTAMVGAEPAEANLGPGTDDRAVAPQALTGSRIELTINLSKPVEIPESVLGLFVDTEDPAQRPDFGTVRRDGATWRIAWTLSESLRLPITLVDEHGIQSIDEAVYRFEAIEDRPAAATITQPSGDRTVLPTARVPVTGEGRDDVGLAWVAVEAAAFTPAGKPQGERSGPGGAMQPIADPLELARVEAPGQSQARASVELDLATLSVKPGDEVKLTALALDVLAASADVPTPTRSAPRTLRIISETQLVEELQRELAEIRQSAIRIDEQQNELRERTMSGRADAQTRRGQGQVGERLSRQGEQVRRLVERLGENQMADRGLDDLLQRAGDTLRDAGESSNKAAQALDRAAEAAPQQQQPQPRRPEGEQPASPQDASRDPQAGTPQGGQSQQSQQSQQGAQSQQGSPSQQGQQGQQGQSAQQSGSPQGNQQQQNQQQQQGDQPQAAPQQPADPSEPQAASREPQADLPPEAREAAQAQQEVQEQLRGLIELLDRGEDNWVARNNVERLLREQRELREQTRQVGQKTQGREVNELSQEQKDELEQIQQKQNELSERAADAAEDMRRREEELREKDPAAAQGMAQAARRSEQRQVSQTMRQAGRQAQQNQTSQAQRSQQQAEQALEEMLEDLDRVNQNREEQLRRTLASVIETLEGLIAQQESEIAALNKAVADKTGLAGLDAGMIRLNQNTIAAVDLIREGGAELAPVASLVSRASDAQGSAITELRRPILGATMVREFEVRSLNLLTEARDKAKEIAEKSNDREQRRKMGELRKAYREILERQTSIVDETRPLAAADELTRRDRNIARALGERQEAVRLDLADLLTKTADLQSAKVFEHQHRRLDTSALRAVAALNEGEPNRARSSQDALVAGLRAIIEALSDPKKEEDKFSQGPQDSGGGGGGGGGQEPLINNLKELRLLRAMQQSIALTTTELSNEDARPSRAELQQLAQEQRDLMRIGEELLNRMQGAQNPEEALNQQIGPGRPDAGEPQPKDDNPPPPPDGGRQ